MPVTPRGIVGHTLSEQEFRLLGYLDSRYFLESSTARFSDWDSSFSTKHPDWFKRIEVQSALATLLYESVRDAPRRPDQRILFLGASKGTVATYFHMAALQRAGVLDDYHFTILDYLWEPLLVTQRGEFDVDPQAETDIGVTDLLTIDEYKQRLTGSAIAQGNVCATGLPEASFDVVVAPYIQHHLGYLDKELACVEMERIARPGALLLLGDLTFDYPAFTEWLGEHVVEEVPYALESFISVDEHVAMFRSSDLLTKRSGSFYYSTALRRR